MRPERANFLVSASYLEHCQAHIGQQARDVRVEARGGRAVDDAMVVRERERQHQSRHELPSVPNRLIAARLAPDDRDFGALTIGENVVPPIPPRLEIVNVPPSMSDALELAVARLALRASRVSAAIAARPLVRILDHGNDETARRVGRKSDVVVLLEDQLRRRRATS